MGILLKCFGGSGSTKQPPTTIEHLCHRFSLAQLRKSTNNFHTSQLIGSGAFGDAYRGCISINGEPIQIAVKRVRAGSYTPPVLSLFKNEILFMCQLHHPNLVSLVGFCNDEKAKEFMVVYEYMPNGSLADQLDGRDNRSPILSWKKRLEVSIGAARALHYLHAGTKRTIFHRDVKPYNILLDENCTPKLTGFGFALKGPKFSSKAPKPIELDHIAGTYGYIAPEYIFHRRFTDKCDVYSFGVVLLALICGKSIHEIYCMISEEEGEDEHTWLSFDNKIKELQNAKAMRIIDPSLVGQILPECWKLYMDITQSCLSEDENPRPAMGEVEVELERVLEIQEEADANIPFHAFLWS